MKFNLTESLFDDDMSFSFDEPAIKVFDEGHFDEYKNDEYDDTPFIYEPLAGADAPADHNGEAIPEGPSGEIESGIADSLIHLINDEWEAIQGYNNFRSMIQSLKKDGYADYEKMLNVIDEIVNEENLHVGQLQELLKHVSPNTDSINAGQEEAQQQLQPSGNEWIDGRLKVDMHEPKIKQPSAENSGNPNEVDTTCTLCDADDEW